jgi:hypothetical protein
MDDETATDPGPEAPISEPPISEAPSPRRKVSRKWVAALAVASALLVGAAAVVVVGHDRHDRAGQDRSHAETRLRAQRRETSSLERELASTTNAAKTLGQQVAVPIGTATNLVSLAGQDMAVEPDVERFGVSGSAADYDATIDRANALVDQYNAVLAQLQQQIEALPGYGSGGASSGGQVS